MKGRAAMQMRRYGRSVLLLLLLVITGTAAGAYILLQQRLPNPFQSYYTIKAAFPTAAAVVPGLGEPVNVAGVRVGEITGASLKDGHGVVEIEIDPSKVPHLYRDAHARLVPNTPLKDMEIDVAPGTKSAGVLADNATIPVGQTTTPTDSDELLAGLDADTRAWLSSLITEFDNGTRGRGPDIRSLLRTLGPTSAQLRQIGDLLAARRHELAALVHNLGTLSSATNAKDAQLATVIDAGDRTVSALAGQDAELRDSIQRLPGTLSTARSTLADLGTLSNVLGPTATALLPTARNLPATLRHTRTLFQGAALLPLDEIPPFVDAVTPLARKLPGLQSNLRQAVPALINSFKVLDYTTNEIAYNAGGRNPGFLYWLSWFVHNADSFIGNSDANGPVWRSIVLTSCAGLKSLSLGQLIETVLGTNFGC